jgi:hypothetical protein
MVLLLMWIKVGKGIVLPMMVGSGSGGKNKFFV